MISRIFIALLQLLAVCQWHAAPVHAADTPLANGVLLVAKPDLLDPNFRETVVLITQPVAGGGPLGVILNRPIAARLSDALPGVGTVPEEFDQIYGGGPVSRNQLIFLVRTRDRAENGLRVLDDVYLSGDSALLKRIVSREVNVGAFRAYGGYAGWAPRQLQAEIAAGGWYLFPADADTIFTADVATMWPDLIKRITRRSTRYVPHDRDGSSGTGVTVGRISEAQSAGCMGFAGCLNFRRNIRRKALHFSALGEFN